MREWVSVKHRLPDKPGSKIVFVPTADPDSPFIGIAWFEPEGTKNLSGWQLLIKPFCDRITHWMELPLGPMANLAVEAGATELEFIPVLQNNLHECWPLLKLGLEQIRAEWPVDWIPEDLYSSLRGGNSEAFILKRAAKDIGFFVAYKSLRAWSGVAEYLIWILWTTDEFQIELDSDERNQARKELLVFIKQRAKELSCGENISCISPRMGYKKLGFELWMIHYRMKV